MDGYQAPVASFLAKFFDFKLLEILVQGNLCN